MCSIRYRWAAEKHGDGWVKLIAERVVGGDGTAAM